MGRLRRLDVIRKGKRIRLLCISICVRNKNLLGATGSGIDGISERQQFLLQLVSRYSPLFALEVFSAVALSDALLVHLELRPDWARMWSKEELLRRAWEAFPNLVKEYCRERNIEFDPQQGPPEVLLSTPAVLEEDAQAPPIVVALLSAHQADLGVEIQPRGQGAGALLGGAF
ncbi:MAG: hypothetical protein KatS3mg110_2139 [Pirellulaceae bacterium]|nr:MAG: hypothetical protein KatS3mg110_2139 [Pirellulaceae bacterium]